MQARIAVLPGDGIGPEVTREGVKVLQRVAELFGHDFAFEEAMVGGCAIDAAGTPLTDETLEMCRRCDAILLGAVGGPKWSDPNAPVRPEQGLLRLRKAFDLFANLRPVKLSPFLRASSPLRDDLLDGVDLLVVRELTGGLYFGPMHHEGEGRDEQAYDTMLYHAWEVERVVRLACNLAKGRRGWLTSVDKANVLESSRLWRRVTERVMREMETEVELEHLLVDACAMHLLRRPADFDVIVTANLFGDILTDEASMLAGSLGLLPSASIGEGTFGLYEPVHGSAPDIAGQGVANPLATILSAAMLLRHSLGLEAEAQVVEQAVESTLEAGYRTADLGPGRHVSTEEMGRAVVERISV
ncbi:MAG: 3-isopropylmalate dehydrogenase [Chloroflexi bacterium]|nr:3-isopropylmalate dehydrogenase [Chloroflexota bacterium]